MKLQVNIPNYTRVYTCTYLLLQVANFETSLQTSESKLRGLESSEGNLEKQLINSRSNKDLIDQLQSRNQDLIDNVNFIKNDNSKLNQKLIEIENQLIVSESQNKKLRDQIDESTLPCASNNLQHDNNRRESTSFKDLLNSQIDNLKQNLQRSNQNLTDTQNQLMALERSSKRQIDQLNEQLIEGNEARDNFQSLLKNFDEVQSELDKKSISLENAQNEIKGLQLQLFDEQSKQITQQTNNNNDKEMTISELEEGNTSSVRKSSISLSSSSKLLNEISRLTAMIHRLRADRDESIGRVHFAETELKFSQQYSNNEINKLKNVINGIENSNNELMNQIKSLKINNNEYQQLITNLKIEIDNLNYKFENELTKHNDELEQTKNMLKDKDENHENVLKTLNENQVKFNLLEGEFNNCRDYVRKLEIELDASREECQEAKDDLQDWQEHRLTLQEGAMGTIERIEERLEVSREKLKNSEVNLLNSQQAINDLNHTIQVERKEFEEKLMNISKQLEVSLMNENQRALQTDSKLTQLTDMSNQLRQNFSDSRARHAEEIKLLKNEHAIEIHKIKESIDDNSVDKQRQIDEMIHEMEYNHKRKIEGMIEDQISISKERDHLEQVLENIRSDHYHELQQYQLIHENDIKDLQRRQSDSVNEILRSQSSNSNKNDYEEKMNKINDDLISAFNYIHELEIEIEDLKTSIPDTEDGNTTLNRLFDQKNEDNTNISKISNNDVIEIDSDSDDGNNDGDDETPNMSLQQNENNRSVGDETMRNLFSSDRDNINDQSNISAGDDKLDNLFSSQRSQSQVGEKSVGNETMQNLFSDSIREQTPINDEHDRSVGNETLNNFFASHSNIHNDKDQDNNVLMSEVTNNSVGNETLQELFAIKPPSYDELIQRIRILEADLNNALHEKDQKLTEAVKDSENRIKILYEEFKKSEIENNTNSNAQIELKNLLESIDNDYILFSHHQSQIQTLVEVIFSVKYRYLLSKKLIKDMENQLSVLKSQNDQCVTENSKLNDDKISFENDYNELKNEKLNNQYKLDEVVNVLEKITTDYETKQNELKDLVDIHESQLHESNNKIEILENELKLIGSQSETGDLKNEIEKYKNESNENISLISNLKNDLNLLQIDHQNTRNNFEEERLQFKEQIEKISLENLNEIGLKIVAENKLKERELEINNLNEILNENSNNDELSRSIKENEISNKKISNLQQQLKEIDEKKVDIEGKYNELKVIIDNTNTSLKNNEDKLKEYETSCLEYKKLINDRDIEIDQLKNMQNELKTVMESKERELEVASQSIVSLELEKNNLLVFITIYDYYYHILINYYRNDKLLSINSGNQNQNSDDVEAQLKDINEELEESKERIQSLEKSLESAQQMTEEAEDKVSIYFINEVN